MSLQEEQVYDFLKKFQQGRISRRDFLRAVSTVGGLTVTSGVIPTLLSGCASPQASSPMVTEVPEAETTQRWAEPKRGGTLTLATIDKPVNLDPAFGELYSSIQVYDNIFAKLVYINRNYEIIPGLAKAWRQIDDSTWEFDLVEDAWFHNGEHFTANDVKYTFDRLFDPELAAANAVFFAPLEGVEVVDDFTARIFTEPNWGGLLLALAAFGEIVNQRGIEENDPRLGPVGCGPFKFVEWVKDDHVTLERWDKYYRPAQPYLDRVIFRAIPDDEVRLTGLLTGEFDWIEQVPLQRVEELRESPEIKAHPNGAYFPDLFLLNTSKPPFDKLEVRQALQWALNREALTSLVWFGQAYPTAEAVAPTSPWYSERFFYETAPDLERAKELLAQAGYENGFEVVFAAQPQVPTQPRVGQLLQQQLKPLGIDVNVEVYESARWFEALINKEYEITSTYWSATVDPGDHCYYPLSHSQSPWNFSFFQGPPEYDELLERYRYTLDPEARMEAYAEVVEAHQELAPQVFQVNMIRTYWTTPNVYGVQTLPSLELRMEDVWVDKPEEE